MKDREVGVLLKLSEAIDMLTKINRSDTKRVICDKIHFELETAFSNIHEISHLTGVHS